MFPSSSFISPWTLFHPFQYTRSLFCMIFVLAPALFSDLSSETLNCVWKEKSRQLSRKFLCILRLNLFLQIYLLWFSFILRLNIFHRFILLLFLCTLRSNFYAHFYKFIFFLSIFHASISFLFLFFFLRIHLLAINPYKISMLRFHLNIFPYFLRGSTAFVVYVCNKKENMVPRGVGTIQPDKTRMDLLQVAKLFSYTWTMGLFLCKSVHYMQSVSAICSVVTLTAMSIER